jgi:hypothetical protein
MPIPIVFFLGFLTWGFHNHFVEVRYTTRGPIGRNIVYYGSPSHFRPILVIHPTCVFFSLVDDTHIVDLTSNVVFSFLQLEEELLALGLSM